MAEIARQARGDGRGIGAGPEAAKRNGVRALSGHFTNALTN
jgi:hypothetical protein